MRFQVSPDGRHAWDGRAWLPVSPDGYYAWDGQQWVLMAGFHPTPPIRVPGGSELRFQYPGVTRKARLPEQFAVVDLETTGFSPTYERVVEVAVVRMDRQGRVLSQWQSLVNPGRDTGPAWIHRITDSMVSDAPTFDDLADDLAAQLSGAVIVAHNAGFEEKFLAAEFRRTGAMLPAWPALDTLDLARATVNAPNYRLATLTESFGIPHVDAHSALGDARATAALLPFLLRAAGGRLAWESAAPAIPIAGQGRALPRPPGDPYGRQAAGYELADGLRKGAAGWMSNLMTRIPEVPAEAQAETAAYIEVLTVALADGRITGDEARALAVTAGTLGLSKAQVHALNEQVLAAMWAAAIEDNVVTAEEYKLLVSAAHQLDRDGYYDPLAPYVQRAHAAGKSGTRTRTRCGNCGNTGHNRRTCPAGVM